MAYYARNDEEREFDQTIKESIKKSKSRSHMALYLQGQEELNLLRHMIDNQYALEDDLRTIHDLVKNLPVYQEQYDIEFSNNDGYLMVKKELDELRMAVDDLTEFICEKDERGGRFDWHGVENKFDKKIKEDAMSMVRQYALDSKLLFDNQPSFQRKKQMFLWDYILNELDNKEEE